MEKLKLYYLNPNDYGLEMFVLAQSKESAFKFFKKKDDLNECKIRLTDIKNLPNKYTIDEFNEGQVVESEVC